MSVGANETTMRYSIDKLLRESGWVLPAEKKRANVDVEVPHSAGFADYVLNDSKGSPICVIEAKSESKDPLVGKEQARKYANELNCRFIILSNGVEHYFWDIENGNPTATTIFPTQELMEVSAAKFNPPRDDRDIIKEDYIAETQFPNLNENPDYKNSAKREDFIKKHKLRILRDYQLEAIQSVQKGVKDGKNRFLLEMATGTGKTLISSAIIKMFMRCYGVKRVLFLVDRLELESQAKKEFDEVLHNDYRTVIWKKNKREWKSANIVISTVQSFIHGNKYRKLFNPDDFDLVISDEAHRSLGRRSRKVFEYFMGFKLGLTATPRDFMKAVNVEEVAVSDPRGLEKRLMADTYTTFGCESGEPTFRYSLEDGVKKGFLINPKVFDARTDITTELLSEEGYTFKGFDENGDEFEEDYNRKDFEKKFFSDNTNRIFCQTFLENALKDPYTGEIGKTLIFCVSQRHAGKITQILNDLAPKEYNSNFAVQVTSQVPDAQQMTIDFRNNALLGNSSSNDDYRTSKARICVTVGMMTTGYDCSDILNICLMRPIYSPSEFIQIKGRGTRRHNFSNEWIDKSAIPEFVESKKKIFGLFDFFAVCEYFEKDFDYDKALNISDASEPTEEQPPTDIDGATSTIADPLATMDVFQVSSDGMKVDREFFRSFEKTIKEHEIIKAFVDDEEFDKADTYLKDHIWDKPKEYFTLEKLRKNLGLDRRLVVKELLRYVYRYIDYLPLQQECFDEEFDKIDKDLNIDEEHFYNAKVVFEAYAGDIEFRDIINTEYFAELEMHPSGDAFDKLPLELKKAIIAYVNKHIELERLENVEW